jgi:hypothetical protein
MKAETMKPDPRIQSGGGIEHRSVKPRLYPPEPTPAASHGSERENRLRAIVTTGLLPLLLGVAAGVAPRTYSDERALGLLRLVEPHGAAQLRLTGLGRDALHQLAALQAAGDLPDLDWPFEWWASPLLAEGKPSSRGQQVLAWLRAGTMLRRCAADPAANCCEAVAGVHVAAGARALACVGHRSSVEALAMGALDRHLAGVEEVRHG